MRAIAILLLTPSLMLMLINLYGITQSMEQDSIPSEYLIFGGRDKNISSDELKVGINKLNEESDTDFAKRLTLLIADGISHIYWDKYEPEMFHQQIPIWENWILWGMGEFSGISEFERYHFTQINKSIERGIGLCGDVSMLLSEILNENQIKNQIISTSEHVIVELTEQNLTLDPDFGVYFEGSFSTLSNHPEITKKVYLDAGYSQGRADLLANAYVSDGVLKWDGAKHFVTKKYYFERISYVLKWMLPIITLFIGILILKKYAKSCTKDGR